MLDGTAEQRLVHLVRTACEALRPGKVWQDIQSLLEGGTDASRLNNEPFLDSASRVSLGIMCGGKAPIPVLRHLLENGVDVNQVDARGYGLLAKALAEPDAPERARLLLAMGADSQKVTDLGETTIHLWAWRNFGSYYRDAARAEREDTDLLKMLLESGSDPRAPDLSGDTPLDWLTRTAAEAPLERQWEVRRRLLAERVPPPTE